MTGTIAAMLERARRVVTIGALVATPACSFLIDFGGIADEPPLSSTTPGEGGTSDGAIDAPDDGGASDATSQETGAPVTRRLTFEDSMLVNSSTGADAVEGDVDLVKDGGALESMYSARIRGINRQSTLTVRVGSHASIVVTFLLRIDMLPSGKIRIVRIAADGQTYGVLALLDTGALSVGTGTSSGTQSSTLVTGTTYRVRLEQTGGPTPTVSASVAPFPSSPSTPFGSEPVPGGRVDTIEVGQTVASNFGMNIVVDDVLIEAR